MDHDTQANPEHLDHTPAVDGNNQQPEVVAPEAMVLDAEHSISAREPERQNLADDVEQFLQSGGQIQNVPKDFRADPPKKPENNYGRGSI